MILNEKTFQKIYGKGEKTDTPLSFVVPGCASFLADIVCVCLFLLIFEDWFRQNIVYVPHGGRAFTIHGE